MRTNLPHVLAVLVAVCLCAQTAAAASTTADLQRERQQTERRGDSVDDELDEARDALARTRSQRDDTHADLRRIDGERTALTAELDALTTELDTAEEQLAAAVQAVRRTDAEIARTNDELSRAQQELETRRALLKARARAAFMYGGVSYAETVLDIDTANELGVSLQYLRTLLREDHDQMQRITALEHAFEVGVERLEELHAAQEDARRQRGVERDRVAGLVDEHRELEARLAARADEHRALLAELESDAQRYAAAVDDLEDESAAIERRLAAIAQEERALEQRRAARSAPAAAAAAPAAPRASSGRFQWPVNGVVTSGFGYRTHPVLGTRRLHAGVDFGAPTGTPIVAAEAGTVVYAGWRGGYGNAVIVDHGGGIATLYGHQSRLAVSYGTRVSRGQVVGYVGSTGMSTGPHLHFEVRRNGVPTDPMARL